MPFVIEIDTNISQLPLVIGSLVNGAITGDASWVSVSNLYYECLNFCLFCFFFVAVHWASVFQWLILILNRTIRFVYRIDHSRMTLFTNNKQTKNANFITMQRVLSGMSMMRRQIMQRKRAACRDNFTAVKYELSIANYYFVSALIVVQFQSRYHSPNI